MKDKGTTYRDAGVDIDAGDTLVERIKPLARRTARPEVLAGIGGFGGLFEVPQGYRHPVLVVGTDGVGTKLKLAFLAGKHDTVGIDLVAMSVNDVVVCGAEPVVFLDYFATSRLEVAEAEQVIKGIAEGCVRAGCALIGGETAELPGFYGRGEYDLAGFCVGIVEKSRILDGSRVKAADVVLGMASSGLHSNGFSLVRKVFESDLCTPSRTSPAGGFPATCLACFPMVIGQSSGADPGPYRASSSASRKRAKSPTPRCCARSTWESACARWSRAPTRPRRSSCSPAAGRRRSRSASSRASPGCRSPRWS